MSEWLPDDAGVWRDDQDGDDQQIGQSFSIRFRRADMPGAIITRTAYPVNVGSDRKGPFLVRVETEWLVCRDPKDPGGTEVASSRRLEDGGEFHETAEDAERAAWSTANELSGEAAFLAWDGQPDWESDGT